MIELKTLCFSNGVSCGLVSALCISLLWTGTAEAQAPVTTPQTATPAPAGTTGAGEWQAPNAGGEADTNTATMNRNLSAFAALGYAYGTGYGLGARYQLIFADHVLNLPAGKHDEFGVEFGIDYFHVSYGESVAGYSFDWSYNEVTPVVGVTWNFWLSDRLAVYPKIDLGYRFISFSNHALNGLDAGVSHLYFQGTGGIVYDLGPVKLRGELGWEALHVGASIVL